MSSNLYSAKTTAIFEAVGGKLTRPHAAELAASGISPEAAKLRGYQSVPANKARSILCIGYRFAIEQAQLGAGLLMPLHGVRGGPAEWAIFKPDNPLGPKYEHAVRAPLQLDVPPICQPDLGKSNIPKFITNGVKQADAIASAGQCAISMLRYQGWCDVKEDGSKAPLDDWHQVALDGCRVYLAFDVSKEADGAEARQEFINFLSGKGAAVHVLQIPQDAEGTGDSDAIIGIDAYLATGGDLEQLMLAADQQRLTKVVKISAHRNRQAIAKKHKASVRMLDRSRSRQRSEDNQARAVQAVLAPNATPDHPWFLAPGGMFQAKFNRRGIREGEIKLTNFIAHIKQRNTYYVGGSEPSREYVVSADFQGKVTSVTVPVKVYPSMRWVEQIVPPGALVFPGQKSKAEHAIVELSIPIRESRVYGDMGWRRFKLQNGQSSWRYFHAGGVIGEAGTDTRFRTRLEGATAEMKLELPANDQQRAKAVRASVELCGLGPRRIMVPLLAGVYAVALGRCDFSFHLNGPSGTFKSSLAAAAAQQHFGRSFRFDHLPASWAWTAAALEHACHATKDAVLAIDELMAEDLTRPQAAEMKAAAAMIFRAQANQQARGRMTGGMRPRPILLPRGLPISTGEHLPGGANSLLGRILVLEFEKGDFELESIMKRQALGATGAYARAMGSFIQWVVPGRVGLERIKNELFDDYQKAARSAGVHVRTPGIIANLRLAWQALLAFARDSNAMTEDELEELWTAGIDALHEAGQAQAQFQQAHENPVLQFFTYLGSAIATRRANIASPKRPYEPPYLDTVTDQGKLSRYGWHVEWVGTHQIRDPLGRRIGWLNNKDLYLNPQASYAVAQQIASHESFTITFDELQRRLLKEGYLVKTEPPRYRYVRRVSIGGLRTQVWHVRASVLNLDDDEPAPNDAGETFERDDEVPF